MTSSASTSADIDLPLYRKQLDGALKTLASLPAFEMLAKDSVGIDISVSF